MLNFLSNAIIGNEIYFVYGLIALVIILIVIIVIIDKTESKKKKNNLFDTLNMKIIADPYQSNEEPEEKIETIEIETNTVENNFDDLEPINEVNIIQEEKILNDEIKEIADDIYIEDELDKTQAQIRVEEITKALKDAQVEEKIEKDKYEQFEEEQEKNAIISYNELKNSFDKLYEENERIQYLEDDEIPINIDELYKLKDEQENTKKVKLDDFSSANKEKIEEVNTTSKFKNSPYISPVYGIQEPPVEVKKTGYDKEIENTTQFLQTLKELKNNLD